MKKLYPSKVLTPVTPEGIKILSTILDADEKEKTALTPEKYGEWVSGVNARMRKYLGMPNQVFWIGKDKNCIPVILLFDLKPDERAYQIHWDDDKQPYIWLEES